MSGLGLVIPGVGPGTGPVVPATLFSPGLSGYTHRWSAARLTGADGDAVTTLADYGSNPQAVNRSSGTSSILKKDLAFNYLRLNATQFSTGTDTPGTNPFTLALLARSALLSASFLQTAGFGMKRAGTGVEQISSQGAGGSGSLNGTDTATGGWGLWVATFVPGGSSSLRASSTVEVTGSLTPGVLLTQVLGSLTAGNVDIASAIIWDNIAATTPQRAAIYAAFQAAFPTAALG